MTPYTYFIKHLPTGKMYYGVKYGQDADPDMFWKPFGYFTSSKAVHLLLEQDGPESFFTEVRRVFKTRHEAVEWENSVLCRLKVYEKEEWLNKVVTIGGHIYGVKAPMPQSQKDAIGAGNKGHRPSRTGPLSEETKRKISLSNTGKKRTPEQRARVTEALQRRFEDPAEREKLSLAHKGKPAHNRGKPMTEEQKLKIRAAKLGKKRGPHSEETRRKIRESNRATWLQNHPSSTE